MMKLNPPLSVAGLCLFLMVGLFVVNSYADEVTIQWDGGTYTGEVSNGVPNGQGAWSHPDGMKYVGEWKEGKADGQGTLTVASGMKYVGEWKDDKFHGQGTVTFPDGMKYVGEWKDDKFHGQGTETFSDGGKYVGEYKDGKRHGQGTLTFAEGGEYVGGFKDGKFHGQGTLTFADGGKYVGEYNYDKRHGQGTETFSDGGKYVGEYNYDKRHGQGTLTFADGGEYVGGFKDGKFHGQGTFTFPDGSKKTARQVREEEIIRLTEERRKKVAEEWRKENEARQLAAEKRKEQEKRLAEDKRKKQEAERKKQEAERKKQEAERKSRLVNRLPLKDALGYKDIKLGMTYKELADLGACPGITKNYSGMYDNDYDPYDAPERIRSANISFKFGTLYENAGSCSGHPIPHRRRIDGVWYSKERLILLGDSYRPKVSIYKSSCYDKSGWGFYFRFDISELYEKGGRCELDPTAQIDLIEINFGVYTPGWHLELQKMLEDRYERHYMYSDADWQSFFFLEEKEELYIVYNDGQVAIKFGRYRYSDTKPTYIFLQYRNLEDAAELMGNLESRKSEASDF
jgi:hypothetical protein